MFQLLFIAHHYYYLCFFYIEILTREFLPVFRFNIGLILFYLCIVSFCLNSNINPSRKCVQISWILCDFFYFEFRINKKWDKFKFIHIFYLFFFYHKHDHMSLFRFSLVSFLIVIELIFFVRFIFIRNPQNLIDAMHFNGRRVWTVPHYRFYLELLALKIQINF